MAVKKLGSTKATDSLLVTSANLASEVTGILGVANGGTGQSTFTDGQILVGVTSGNTLAKVSVTGDVTISNAGVTAIGSLKVTNSMLAGSIAATKLVGSDIATLGTVVTGTWSATTIAVNKGGTGETSYTNGQLLIGNTSGNTLTKGTLTQGSNIAITNGTGTITIAAMTASQNNYQIFAGPPGTGAAAPTFRSLVAGDISDGLLNHSKLTIPFCEAQASSGQSISNTTLTYIDLQTENADTDNMHSTSSNTSRITASTQGKYLIVGSIPFAGVPGACRILARIYKNRTSVVAAIDQQVASGSPAFNLTAIVDLDVADYVEMAVYHDAGSSFNLYNDSTLKAIMSAVRIR